MGIQFDDTFVWEQGKPQTVEDSIKVYASWSGIHQFSFDHVLQNASVDSGTTELGDWENFVMLTDPVPHDCLVEFEIKDPHGAWDGWGVILGHQQETGIGYIIGIDGDTNYVFLGRYNTNTKQIIKLVESIEWYHGTEVDVKVSMRQVRFSEEESDLWHVFTIWTNGMTMVAWAIKVDLPITNETYIGFASHFGGTVFTNVRVPQLTQFAEWASIDPGEPPIGGLERTIEGRYVKYFVRADGSLRAWRSRPRNSELTFVDDTTYTGSLRFDRRMLYNHVRMLGGYAEAEYVEPRLVKYGHRFKEVNNPYILSDDECLVEAKDEIRRMEEQSIQQPFETPFTPTLEPEDRVTTPDGERIVTQRQWRIQPGTITQQISTRLYAYQDEP